MGKHNGKTNANKKETSSIPCKYTIGNIEYPTNYEQTMKSGDDIGIDITHVRSYLNHKQKENIEMHIKLPYKYNEKNVWAYVVVDCDETHKLNDNLRAYNTCEIWTDEPGTLGSTILSQNEIYDDLYKENEDGTKEQIDGRFICDEIGVFASAASNYPHVCTYDEYITLKTPSNQMLQIDAPNEEDYYKYIDKCINLMKHSRFIGKIKKPDQAEMLKMDTPSSRELLENTDENNITNEYESYVPEL